MMIRIDVQGNLPRHCISHVRRDKPPRNQSIFPVLYEEVALPSDGGRTKVSPRANVIGKSSAHNSNHRVPPYGSGHEGASRLECCDSVRNILRAPYHTHIG
eukprot:1463844-Amphidinium_carterae.1